jgi:hypothetical protein
MLMVLFCLSFADGIPPRLIELNAAAAGSVAAPAAVLLQAQTTPVRLIPGLLSLTFWERTGGTAPVANTFAAGSPQLESRLNDPLGPSNRDFTGFASADLTEAYDVFYSNADGTPNRDGAYVTVEAVWERALPAGGGLNIAEVQLDFANPATPPEYAYDVTSFVGLGDNFIPVSVANAVDGDLQTATTMGNTIGQSRRLRLTVAFASSVPPPPPTLAILDTEVVEGNTGTTNAVLRVGLSRTSSSDVMVDYATAGFSAVAGRDYIERAGTLTIPAGSLSRDITVQVLGDTLPEWTQTFLVRLNNPRGATISDGEAAGGIRDDDEAEALTRCSSDTPMLLENDQIDAGDNKSSVITIDSDMIIDDLEVQAFFSSVRIESGGLLALVEQARVGNASLLFLERGGAPERFAIGSTCTPSPDVVFTNQEMGPMQGGLPPYLGAWRARGLQLFEGGPARGPWKMYLLGTDDSLRTVAGLLQCWCVKVVAAREGLRLDPPRATRLIGGRAVITDSGRIEFFPDNHEVRAQLMSNGGPAAGVRVTFQVRALSTGVIIWETSNTTDEMGRTGFAYTDYVPGEYAIEARAEVGGAIYTDVAQVTWTSPCAATEVLQAAPQAEASLDAMRAFRDSKLAKSKRGQRYSQLYYRLSSDAIRTMMLSPMLMLRSQEMIERYVPVVRDMAEGKDVTLTDGDLAEIESFLASFAAKGSPELKQSVEELRKDLRDPEVHREFGVKIAPGPRREASGRGPLQSLMQAGQMTMFSGFVFALGFCAVGRRSQRSRGRSRAGACAMLAALLVGGSSWLGSPAFRRYPVSAGENSPPEGGTTKHGAAKRGLRFEPNQGQADRAVKFISRAPGYQLALGPTGAVMTLRRQKEKSKSQKWKFAQVPAEDRLLTTDLPTAYHRSLTPDAPDAQPITGSLRMTLLGANPNPEIRGMDPLPTTTNYFGGKDPSSWRSNVPSYSKVKCTGVYDGIDLLYYGEEGQIEYDFTVAPGADPDSIKLGFEGADSIDVDEAGDLVMNVAGAHVRHRKPFVYQELNGARMQIAGRYKLLAHAASIRDPKSKTQNHTVGFEIGAYDPALPLVIDPVLEYSTYLGGSGDDEGTAIAADTEGNVYIAGITDSADLPATNDPHPVFGGGGQDVFLAKLDPTGSRLIYLTYLGGSGAETAGGIAVDASGNAYVTGFTDSLNFPTLNALQANNRGRFNAFVVKLGPAGNLINSTYLGGTASDAGSGIAVDAAGNVYLSGIATSPNFPTLSPMQSNLMGASDIFIAKLSPAGDRLLYSTYLGGSQDDAATSLAIDPAGNAYVTGATLSSDFRTLNAAQAAHRGGIFDAFAAKINPSGSQLVYSTYLGGGNADRGLRIVADSAGNAYVTGDTRSTNFPTANPVQAAIGGSADAFITKLNSNGSLAYSTYFGGSGLDGGTAIRVNASGSAIVTGFTDSINFPTAGPVQLAFGGGSFDAFVTKLNPAGSTIAYSTYLGGGGTDAGFGVAVDPAGSAYVMGLTDSTNFPTERPFQPASRGGISDLFIAKLRSGPSITSAEVSRKRLIVRGSEFDQGAKILINGESQKTYNNAENPTGILIAKKAGRQIGPGQSVTLQVRNADGSLSNQLRYTRTGQ